MKKSIVILIISALLLASLFAVFSFAAAGDESDPLVTKSYIDKIVSELKSDKAKEASEYEVLELSAGQTVVGGASCEMILRSGEAKASIPETAGGGISDLTAGTDIKDAKSISANHLLLFPRDDGRGIKCTSNAFVMVKGNYTIK